MRWVKFILAHVPFTCKSNSENCIKICWRLIKLQTKISCPFLWPTVYIALHLHFTIFLKSHVRNETRFRRKVFTVRAIRYKTGIFTYWENTAKLAKPTRFSTSFLDPSARHASLTLYEKLAASGTALSFYTEPGRMNHNYSAIDCELRLPLLERRWSSLPPLNST